MPQVDWTGRKFGKLDGVSDEPEAPKIKTGQKVYFDPFKDITGFSSEMNRGNTVTGTVVYVNHPHKWFSVEHGEAKQRMSFKYSDIGNTVKLCK